jgi:hypothetical protein
MVGQPHPFSLLPARHTFISQKVGIQRAAIGCKSVDFLLPNAARVGGDTLVDFLERRDLPRALRNRDD